MNDSNEAKHDRHRVVILGGGFAGLAVARGLRGAAVDVTLVDRRNFHLFQPLLYQVATGGLSPAEISMPLRSVLKRQDNATVLMTEAEDLDPDRRRVLLATGELPYDTLVIATGARHHYFGHPEWEELAPGLKTVEDATTLRARILGAFEQAERTADARERERLLTFVVVGAGPTGVEMAGAIGELARYTLRREFRRAEPTSARILLVEGVDRVLPPYPEVLSRRAAESLRQLGVEILTGTRVEALNAHSVLLSHGEESEELPVGVVVWAAGVKPSRLARILEAKAGAELARSGKVVVDDRCVLPGYPEIFVLGDLAHCTDPEGDPLPGVAPVAMQQGRYAAKAIRARLDGREPPLFRYTDKGDLAVIGRAAAVADVPLQGNGRLRFAGLFAWLLWLFVHILYLVGFSNRLQVLLQWAYSYLTRGRGARLITQPWKPEGPTP